MTDYMAQMLNELMGSQRNALPGERKEVRFDDPDVCTDFLVGFCTHELFRNTKNDLGYCRYPVHDENMKKQYQESEEKYRLKFEERFLERIRRIHDDVQRKITKHQERLLLTQGDTSQAEEVFQRKLAEISDRREQINKRIENLMEEAQLEGEKGNVQAAQAAVEKADRAKADRDELDEEEAKILDEKARAISMEENVTQGSRQMSVCQVCGCFMLQNDAPQRIDDHLSGKLHLAYQTIAETITKMEEAIREKHSRRKTDGDEKRKDRKRENERKRSRSRDRNRDNRRYDRDRRDRDRYRDDKKRRVSFKFYCQLSNPTENPIPPAALEFGRRSQRFARPDQGLKLELTSDVINEALEFPEEFDFNDKSAIHYTKEFIRDVTGFEEKVELATKLIYDESTQSIAEYLELDEVASGSNLPISVFCPTETFGRLRTALVQCNFTDISRFIRDLHAKLVKNRRQVDDDEEIVSTQVTIVGSNDPIHTIIDRIRDSKMSRNVIIVQQFESLQQATLDAIIGLLYSNETIRKKIDTVRLVVCVSTSFAFFDTNCTIDSINLLSVRQFKFTRLDEIFESIVTTDIAPAIFSGPFLNYLHNRFFNCDYSVSALIKAVQFAFLAKYLQDPLWKMDNTDHSRQIENYELLLKFVNDEIFVDKSLRDLHVAIQTDADFWKNSENSIENWKRFQFETRNLVNFEQFLTRLERISPKIESTFDEKLKTLMKNVEAAVETENTEATTTTQRSPLKTPRKSMTFLEMQRQRHAEMAKKHNNSLMSAKLEVFKAILEFFKKHLRPYPSTWRNVIGGDHFASELTTTGLDANDEIDIERALLVDEKFKNEPIAIAWKCLLRQNQFKSVKIEVWAQEFMKKFKSKNEASDAFFAAAGQLEHMGLIRAGADRKSTKVHILYHPISFEPNL
ncbi:unnamed protein product [Caenorhabditis bovis]|uniref:Origin recognition complex subunit 3 N-terminal domain-containing protein n=1 Tax=Caenorhabditis bovis TaxID=2654633 RepID=A0A8S1EV88_9PELO|nr:unnamed protein product [Caenorhabditis bovis]